MEKSKKRFGQHFLRDHGVVAAIVAAVGPHKGEQVVEIGPGFGALTTALLAELEQIEVVEIDREIIPQLKLVCENFGKLTIYNEDILRFELLRVSSQPHSLRLVGNLPYNISTPLIFWLLRQLFLIKDMHFMVQKEVAERIVATSGSKKYGRLSIMVQYHCQCELLFTVPKEAFYPPPKVESAVIRLVPRSAAELQRCEVEKLSLVVAKAFMQRRKTLKNALKNIVTEEQFVKLGIDSQLRAEQLALEDFINLTKGVF